MKNLGIKRVIRYLEDGTLPRQFAWKSWIKAQDPEIHLTPFGKTYRLTKKSNQAQENGSRSKRITRARTRSGGDSRLGSSSNAKEEGNQNYETTIDNNDSASNSNSNDLK